MCAKKPAEAGNGIREQARQLAGVVSGDGAADEQTADAIVIDGGLSLGLSPF